MGEVIPLGGMTKLHIPPDKILEAAKGELDEVIIIGRPKDKSSDIYTVTSISDGAEILWLLRACEQILFGNLKIVEETTDD